MEFFFFFNPSPNPTVESTNKSFDIAKNKALNNHAYENVCAAGLP
jgi:hypothetical protein